GNNSDDNVRKTFMSVDDAKASFARSTATVDAVVTAYEEVSPSREFVGTGRTQVLLLRIRRVLRGHEDSRYIIVRNLYGGTDQLLSGQDLTRKKSRRFSLTRDYD